jgi:hypothetical protein
MAVENEPDAVRQSTASIVGIVAGVFGGILLLAAVAYLVMLHVVDWVTVDMLAYPTAGIAPFAVITGAILTIPIVIPTVLVSLKLLKQ